ncbi:hypothetical protein QAD02_004071 [Eretmocerus hayati]|uniref:Uncharacterized protein n=1 Tax=Eretmocerus hayati TaxID=131215 RepID=A0ACC2NPI7_9HYME|nr:hypothetical protein QAD02_004071 [Eretmocerus hayati]
MESATKNLDSDADVSKQMGWRHVQALLLFSGMATAYALRVCMSVAIVAMRSKESANPDFPEYDWDQQTSSLILSSFYWGYVFTQFPSGYLARTWSAKKLLGFGIFTCSAFNVITPFVSEYGHVPVIISRVAMGLSQGCLIPCVHTLMSRWVPPTERARLGSLVSNATQFGTLITLAISGVLAASRFGWPSIFYAVGTSGILWSILFLYAGADYPSEHPSISHEEAEYINTSLGSLDKIADAEKPKIPWKAILTSLPLWANIISNSGNIYGFYTLLTQLPTYMKYVLNFDISQNGGISALPYLAMWLMGFPISYLADYALAKGVSCACVRKVCSTIGLWIPAVALVVFCLVPTTDKVVPIAILVVAVGFNSGVSCSTQINHIDLSPNFTSTVAPIASTIHNVIGILAPYICGIIVTEEHNVDQWHIVFYVTAAVYFVTNLIFLIFGQAEVQPWNDPNYQSKPTLEEPKTFIKENVRQNSYTESLERRKNILP